jgi:drug/metabolite transporter (DMT)-like permease
VIVVFGLLILKRAQARGVSSWTSVVLVCWASAFAFSFLTILGGTMQPIALLWQPAVVGALFLSGQLLTFLAVHRGDVSIAAPVMGVKVLMVPAFAPLFVEGESSQRVWAAAAIAVVGIALVQARDASIDRSRILASVGFALFAAFAMTLFDLLIQRWAFAWGAGYFLPISFAFAAALSLVFLPWADSPARLKELDVLRPLGLGAVLMSVQAIGMTLTLGLFGDATRVNIVYSLRGLWGVLLTWFVAHRFEHSETVPSHRVMSKRLAGAVLIGISVIIAVT